MTQNPWGYCHCPDRHRDRHRLLYHLVPAGCASQGYKGRYNTATGWAWEVPGQPCDGLHGLPFDPGLEQVFRSDGAGDRRPASWTGRWLYSLPGSKVMIPRRTQSKMWNRATSKRSCPGRCIRAWTPPTWQRSIAICLVYHRWRIWLWKTNRCCNLRFTVYDWFFWVTIYDWMRDSHS